MIKDYILRLLIFFCCFYPTHTISQDQLPTAANQSTDESKTESKADDLEHKAWYMPRTLSLAPEYFEFNRSKYASAGINLSYTTQQFRELYFLGSPAIEIGAMINTEISHKTSYAYAGLTWDLFLTDHFFLTLDLGGVLVNNESGKDYGPNLNFREQFSLGYQIYETEDDIMEVVANIGHLSHAGLGGDTNPGANWLSLGLQWRFK